MEVKAFPIFQPHGDNHHLWINPHDNSNIINSNDGGTNISFNGVRAGVHENQSTAQFVE